MPRKPKYKKAEVMKAIKGCQTITSVVAKRLKCDWNTAHIYINKWPDTKAAYENERQTSIDTAESALFKNIQNGDFRSIQYFLSHQAKDRGYGDDPATSTSNENTINIIMDDDEEEDDKNPVKTP